MCLNQTSKQKINEIPFYDVAMKVIGTLAQCSTAVKQPVSWRPITYQYECQLRNKYAHSGIKYIRAAYNAFSIFPKT